MHRFHTLRFVLLAIWLTLPLSTVGAVDAVPQNGLRLHLDAGRGVEIAGGCVVTWADQSTAGHTASVPADCAAPAHIARCEALGGHPAMSFRGRQLLSISSSILPDATQQLTILAVARTDALGGVGIFSIRQGAVPLVQLDTDSTGRTRFIVRDGQHRTVQALGQPYFGRWGVYTGVLNRIDGGESRAEVFFGAHSGQEGQGVLAAPIVGDAQWIGALPLGDRLLSWNGEIAEILVYDHALEATEREQLATWLCEKYGLPYRLKPSDLTADVYPWKDDPKPVDAELSTDICVVGAGSAGIGAALAAARRGAKVILVERQTALGGTGVNALVSCWEPGPGCSIAREIFDRMTLLPHATGVAKQHANISTSFPMGQWYIAPDAIYEQSLRRAGVPPDQMRSVPYDPAALDRVARQLLAETENVTLLDRTTFFHGNANADRSRVESILVEDRDGRVSRIRADVFIDCTGCIHLCRAVGCDVMLGFDPRDRFNEPSAPLVGSLQLNAISRCYSIRPSDYPRRQAPIELPVPYFAKCAHVTGWPSGRRVVNPLPMLPGRALIDYGYEQCMEITDRAVQAHWRWLQATPDFEGYEFERAAPMLGIRESYRVVAQYVLSEHDLVAGLTGQSHDDIIAIADHPCDIHGAGGHLASVAGPYGIPYRCLIPKGRWENLLVACRGAGLSKIAASSCRLQRTMIQLGHAAGAAGAMSVEAGVAVDEIDVDALVSQLNAQSR